MEKITFEQILKNKQRELGLSSDEFAKYIGKHRTWLYNKYCPTGKKYPLREVTMQHFNRVLGISYDIMEEYNKECEESK